MNDRDPDFLLLQRFARDGDQTAFTALVRRHLDLVYGTALRKLEDPGAAEEVAQNVFGALVRKAWLFAADDSLTAWLHRSALLESKRWLRGEMRRRRRERTAADLGTTMKTSEEQPALRALVPLLDEALLSLREKDRTALLLRYYENRSLRDVGAALGVGEDAAQKRVATALGKVSAFFQRRGYATASVAATAAVLEMTAAAAPATVAGSVVLASSQMAAPALTGLMALAARLAALTKLQTTAACLALATLPVVWQATEQQKAHKLEIQLHARVNEARTELSAVRAQIDRLMERSNRLAVFAAKAAESAERKTEAAKRFAAWKERLRTILTADDYTWPDDSPLVKIPKRALRHLQVSHPVRPPGALSREARELLGLTPAEREHLETTLRDHFDFIDVLLDARTHETNQAARFAVPSSAVAAVVWATPPMGDEIKTRGDQLLNSLEAALGNERWPLVKSLLEMNNLESLRWVLNLDAGQEHQEVGAWIRNVNGRHMLDYGYSIGQSSMTLSGQALDLFKPGAEADPSQRLLPQALRRRLQTWIQHQADTLLPPRL